MRALVTGANGFLGRHVVDALLARGVEVRAMVRPAAHLEVLGWPSSVEVFRADLRNSRELRGAFKDVDVLLHLAAVVSGGEDAQFAGTVVGTERLLDAMTTSACRRLVLCSTFSVYDYSSTHRVLDEGSPLHQAPDVYTRDGYTISKWWQERVTRRFTEEHGWTLTVLRPGFVWGCDHGYLAALGQQFGRHHLVIGPLTRLPMTHVENCADVFALAAADARARGQTLNVVDGPGERIWTYLSDYMCGSGQPGWRLPVPYWPPSAWCGWPSPPCSEAPARCPAPSSRVGSSRGSSHSASRTAGRGKRWDGPRRSTTSSVGADLRSGGAHRSRALGRRLFGPLE
jgi:nucleoside-diphosphate-sugar epimerase